LWRVGPTSRRGTGSVLGHWCRRARQDYPAGRVDAAGRSRTGSSARSGVGRAGSTSARSAA